MIASPDAYPSYDGYLSRQAEIERHNSTFKQLAPRDLRGELLAISRMQAAIVERYLLQAITELACELAA